MSTVTWVSARCAMSVVLLLAMVADQTSSEVRTEYDRFTDITTIYTASHNAEGTHTKVKILALVTCAGHVDHCPSASEVRLAFHVADGHGNIVRLRLDGERWLELASNLDFSRNFLFVDLTTQQFRRLAAASIVEAQLSGDHEGNI